jgi:sulfhydrogenase subunit alpha
MKSKVINVDYLARVEGEGGISVKVSGDRVVDVKMNIFEPPRFFEAFLRGRHFSEVPDITARICGICPVAYQMSSCHAIEAAFGVSVNGMLRDLRRLLYCGEWIESHALHVYLLHAPDFLGYEDGLRMAKDHGPVVTQGLKLKKIGNELMIVVGGREIHPINVRVGGFYRVPSKADVRGMIEKLKWARDAAVDMIHFAAKLPFPEFEQDYEFVSLRHPNEYPLCEGRLVSSKGLDIAVSEYERHFAEEHVPHSNALHSLHGAKPYLVGPLARFNLNFDKLTAHCREEAKAAGIVPPVNNPFKSIVVRSVETLWACEEALRIAEHYEPPEPAAVGITPRIGSGSGCTEAPRGILYHRYKLSEQGLVLDARIIPPTSQNLRMMEQDLRQYVEQHVDMPREQLTWQCEQTVRNYDPCISCATHAIRVDVQRDD